MRASTESLVGIAIAMLTGVPALAAEPDEQQASLGTPAPVLGPRLEVRGGVGSPLGTISGAFVLQLTPVFAIGAGAGIDAGEDWSHSYLQLGGFVRANVWRRDRFTLGPVVTLSGGTHVREVTYQRPYYASADTLRYTWKTGVRLDAGVGGEMTFDRLTLRLEAGLGFYLNAPRCAYNEAQPSFFYGACDAPEIPEPYHFTVQPGRLVPYASLAFALHAGRGGADEVAATGAAPGNSDVASLPRRTDSGWLAPTALTVPAGSVTLAFYEAALARVTYGLTDTVQLWGGTSWSFVVAAPVWDLGVKATVLSQGRFHLALIAEHLGARFSDFATVAVVGGGAVGSVCLDAGCESVLSLTAVGGWLYVDREESDTESGMDAIVSPSAVFAVARVMKLVIESYVPASSPHDTFWVAAVRLPLGKLTLDLGALGQFRDFGPYPAGTIAYRW